MNRALCIVPVFGCAVLWLYILKNVAPPIKEGHEKHIKVFSNVEELKAFVQVVTDYYENHFVYILISFSSLYLFKQAFMIPGSALLNVMAGALFGVIQGLLLCCILSSFGALISYTLSRLCLKEFISRRFADKVGDMRQKVSKNKDNLFYYLLFLRLFPMTPNWLLNLISPIINVPIDLFFFTILIGLLPYNLICVQGGVVLSSIKSLDDILTMKTFLQLAGMALVALGPTFFFKKVRGRAESNCDDIKSNKIKKSNKLS